MAMARAVPSSGWSDCGPQASGAGALVMMYLGMEMAMRFSPLSIGAGVGPKEATNMGWLAARPLTNAIHSSSVLKTNSLSPTSQEMVDACVAGSAMTIWFFHLGSAR